MHRRPLRRYIFLETLVDSPWWLLHFSLTVGWESPSLSLAVPAKYDNCKNLFNIFMCCGVESCIMISDAKRLEVLSTQTNVKLNCKPYVCRFKSNLSLIVNIIWIAFLAQSWIRWTHGIYFQERKLTRSSKRIVSWEPCLLSRDRNNMPSNLKQYNCVYYWHATLCTL